MQISYSATNAAAHECLYHGFISHNDSDTYIEVPMRTYNNIQKKLSCRPGIHRCHDGDYISGSHSTNEYTAPLK
jgi:hypothetical protein